MAGPWTEAPHQQAYPGKRTPSVPAVVGRSIRNCTFTQPRAVGNREPAHATLRLARRRASPGRRSQLRLRAEEPIGRAVAPTSIATQSRIYCIGRISPSMRTVGCSDIGRCSDSCRRGERGRRSTPERSRPFDVTVTFGSSCKSNPISSATFTAE